MDIGNSPLGSYAFRGQGELGVKQFPEIGEGREESGSSHITQIGRYLETNTYCPRLVLRREVVPHPGQRTQDLSSSWSCLLGVLALVNHIFEV